jgi:sugar O-acyltransferase (sialic acid O-acetyltransferase NeuD family)
MTPKNISIYGVGGHARAIYDLACDLQVNVLSFICFGSNLDNFLGISVIKSVEELEKSRNRSIVVAVGDNFVRNSIVYSLKRNPVFDFPILAHPTSRISKFAKLGEGTTVLTGVNVGPYTLIGDFCILNTYSSIDHDCNMGQFSSLGPGVITGGNVEIGNRTALGIGCIVKHNVTVGSDAVIGGNSFINRNIPSGVMAFGVPATIKKHRKPDDKYL